MAIEALDDGAVRVVRLSNPTRRNALTRALLAQLSAALPAAAASSTQPVRAVVLAGDPAGGGFSAGFDIGEIDDEERARGADPITPIADALDACPVPVLAAIEGVAFGGALELAMACTMRVAGRGALVAMPPARLGLVYSVPGLQRFLRALAPSRAQRLFLTAAPVSMPEALAWGLVDEVVDDGAALARTMELARTIAALAPLSVAGHLDAIRRVARFAPLPPDDVAAIEASRARALGSQDLAEGLAAFREKRSPCFRGS